MDIKNEILAFMKTRPDVVGIIGYGSGVNPQKGQENRKPQIDLIVIVDNLKRWHKQNIKQNKNDYSFLSRLFFKYARDKWLKAGAKICYMTFIPFKESKYKIGTIEGNDFLNDLKNWETFYMAGRMQKPILIVKANKEIENAIDYNRHAGIKVSKLIINKEKINKKDFYITLGSLSYIGDTRMGIAENPDKVKNIVEGSMKFYNDYYGKSLKIINNEVIIEKEIDLDTLPDDLKEYIDNHKENSIKDSIRSFLISKNKSKSLSQTIKGIFTTGPIKAIKYAKEKLKRGKKK